jgi:hypothetical protein
MASSRLNSMEFWALCGINATISMSDFGRKLKAASMQHQALQRKSEMFGNRLPEYQQGHVSRQYKCRKPYLDRVLAKKLTCNNAANSQERISRPCEPVNDIAL